MKKIKVLLVFIPFFIAGQSIFGADPSADIVSTVQHIIATVGSPEIKNEKDIPVIVERIKKLSDADEKQCAIINSPEVTDDIINRMVVRFKISPVDAAAALQTPAAKKWVADHLDPSEYELFKIVQRIISISEDTAAEFKQKYDLTVWSGQKGWPGCNPYHSQTKSGLFLQVDSIPDTLFTPWGQVKITGGGAGTWALFKAFDLAVLARLKTTIASAPRKNMFDSGDLAVYEMKRRDLRDLIDNGVKIEFDDVTTRISSDEAKAKEGTDAIIFANLCGACTYYNIHAVDGQPLPDPEMLPNRKAYRSYKATNLIWQILDEKYKKEMGGNYVTAAEKDAKMFAQLDKERQERKKSEEPYSGGVSSCFY